MSTDFFFFSTSEVLTTNLPKSYSEPFVYRFLEKQSKKNEWKIKCRQKKSIDLECLLRAFVFISALFLSISFSVVVIAILPKFVHKYLCSYSRTLVYLAVNFAYGALHTIAACIFPHHSARLHASTSPLIRVNVSAKEFLDISFRLRDVMSTKRPDKFTFFFSFFHFILLLKEIPIQKRCAAWKEIYQDE